MKSANYFPPEHPESSIQSVLEWLALANGRTGADDADQLHRQMRLVRAASIPTPQRSKLLDLFYAHTERIVQAELPELHQVTLPVSRRLRQRVRIIQELLETLTQDYLNTLSELFDPQGTRPPRSPSETLRRVLQCIVWNIWVSHLVAAPTPLGLWLQLHGTFNTARRLGIANRSTPPDHGPLQQLYVGALLAAIAQPASFNSRELEFIAGCIEHINSPIQITDISPADSSGVFWIDPKADFPAHANGRRPAPSDIPVWFFSCRDLAQETTTWLRALQKGSTASQLGLPAFADTPGGQGVLRRLAMLWGNPSKRKFPRRRLSYRAHLCAGLEPLWQLLKPAGKPPEVSEWMVTNESPDGYAIMHVSGQSGHLQVGDIVAIQPMREHVAPESHWHVCIVRWALSENPEHIELGLQLLASRAIAAVIAQPLELESGTISALILPENPPLRQSTAVVVATGLLGKNTGKLIVLLEKENLEIREVRPTHLDEQTSSIEIFSIEPDATS